MFLDKNSSTQRALAERTTESVQARRDDPLTARKKDARPIATNIDGISTRKRKKPSVSSEDSSDDGSHEASSEADPSDADSSDTESSDDDDAQEVSREKKPSETVSSDTETSSSSEEVDSSISQRSTKRQKTPPGGWVPPGEGSWQTKRNNRARRRKQKEEWLQEQERLFREAAQRATERATQSATDAVTQSTSQADIQMPRGSQQKTLASVEQLLAEAEGNVELPPGGGSLGLPVDTTADTSVASQDALEKSRSARTEIRSVLPPTLRKEAVPRGVRLRRVDCDGIFNGWPMDEQGGQDPQGVDGVDEMQDRDPQSLYEAFRAQGHAALLARRAQEERQEEEMDVSESGDDDLPPGMPLAFGKPQGWDGHDVITSHHQGVSAKQDGSKVLSMGAANGSPALDAPRKTVASTTNVSSSTVPGIATNVSATTAPGVATNVSASTAPGIATNVSASTAPSVARSTPAASGNLVAETKSTVPVAVEGEANTASIAAVAAQDAQDDLDYGPPDERDSVQETLRRLRELRDHARKKQEASQEAAAASANELARIRSAALASRRRDLVKDIVAPPSV